MVALVTGAAGGIGRAAYDALCAGGEVVLGLDIAPTAQTGLALSGDLCQPTILDEVARAVREAGSLTTVVAAHGIAGAGALNEIDETVARRILEVNTETVIRLWEALRPMLEETRGAFVVVASQAGLVSEGANGVYSASKSALAGWLRGLDDDTVARLRLVHPGATATPLLEAALRGMAEARGVSYETVVQERNAATPVGRLGEPTDIGAAVAWAATLDAQRLVEIAVTGGEVRW